ncbi:MAG: uridine kinase [Gammaproteobacteria bacterium]|jgi:uridine kinase|nr:uridine kinase [Gammaproteobacteria bacterium]
MPQSDRNIIIIGIAGASGSGKSLLANTIVDELGSDRVVVISEDAYYKDLSNLSMEERNKVNFDHPDAFDHKLLVQHLSELKAGDSVNIPVYDYVTHNRTSKTRHISSNNSIVVLEGILLFSEPALRDVMDIRIFVDTALDTSFIRRLRRDVMERGRSMESVIEQYETTVRPMFVQFIEPSKRYADIIVPHGGKNRIAIEVIQAKMKELLNHPSTR